MLFRQLRSKKSSRPKREPHEVKPTQKGLQSKRGVPELYDEIKKSVSYGLTSIGKAGIKNQAQQFNISASEFIEQIGRGKLKVVAVLESAIQQEQTDVERYKYD